MSHPVNSAQVSRGSQQGQGSLWSSQFGAWRVPSILTQGPHLDSRQGRGRLPWLP